MVMESRVHNLLALCVGGFKLYNLLSKKQGFSFPPFETFTASPSMRPFHVSRRPISFWREWECYTSGSELNSPFSSQVIRAVKGSECNPAVLTYNREARISRHHELLHS